MNDPRITAYALNELQGAEREIFEADLATNPHLQRDLLSACELTDALGEVTEEPSERLDPQARARLLRDAIANQQSFRARRKIIRFAVPASLAAAASIALLLLVSGGTTTQKPAVAAARAPEAAGVTVAKSFDAKAIDLIQAVGMPTPAQPEVRQRSLITSEDIALWGVAPPAPGGNAP
ncbi:MAG: hypothetical protein ACKOKC_10585 [Chthoniobacterales bacterium]